MNKNMLVVVVLIALVVISGVQAIQLISLRGKINNAEIISNGNMGSSTSNPVVKTGATGSASVPSSLQNLPSMVGGC